MEGKHEGKERVVTAAVRATQTWSAVVREHDREAFDPWFV
jgi:hypothetical protein